jgi:hypothetical protein
MDLESSHQGRLRVLLDFDTAAPCGAVSPRGEHSLTPVAARLLSCRDRDTRHPPSGPALDERLANVEELMRQLDHVMDDCPPHLKLRPTKANDLVS